jgi:hypothetical protein
MPSIEDGGRRPTLVRPALTSRELASSHPPSRGHFAGSDWSNVAVPGRPVGEDDWLQARRRFGIRCLWRARMSDVATHSKKVLTPDDAAVTAIGALAFIAVLVLGAYAPDLRSDNGARMRCRTPLPALADLFVSSKKLAAIR